MLAALSVLRTGVRSSYGLAAASVDGHSCTRRMSEGSDAKHDPEGVLGAPGASIFARIVGGEIPVKAIYEDDLVMAFYDVNPQAPKHILVIPKTPIGGATEFKVGDVEQQKLLGHLLQVGALVAKNEQFADHGYRFVINEGRDGGQSIRWLHLHVLGGRPLSWPPG